MKLHPTHIAARAPILVHIDSGKLSSFNGAHCLPNSTSGFWQSSVQSWYSFQTSAWNPYLKIDRYWNGVKNHGMLSWFTKNPANSMNGMISTGVRVTANCLSAKVTPRISEQPPEALKIRKLISTEHQKGGCQHVQIYIITYSIRCMQ